MNSKVFATLYILAAFSPVAIASPVPKAQLGGLLGGLTGGLGGGSGTPAPGSVVDKTLGVVENVPVVGELLKPVIDPLIAVSGNVPVPTPLPTPGLPTVPGLPALPKA